MRAYEGVLGISWHGHHVISSNGNDLLFQIGRNTLLWRATESLLKHTSQQHRDLALGIDPLG